MALQSGNSVTDIRFIRPSSPSLHFSKHHSFFFPPPHFKTKKTPRWIFYGEDFLAAGNTIGERM